jgi:hypothetical protein
MMTYRFALAACVAALIAGAIVDGARAQDADRGPWLRIKSPFSGPIWRLDVDRDERLVVASNADKSAPIWTLGDGKPAMIARLPIREEQRRRAHAIAISPNGDLIAYSVPPPVAMDTQESNGDASIYIMNRATGEVIDSLPKTPKQIPTRPQALRFSPDGDYLAAVLSGGCGLRIWSTADWRLVGSDDNGYSTRTPGAVNCCPSGAECSGETTDLLLLPEQNGRPWIFTSGDTGVRSYSSIDIGMRPLKSALPEQLKLARPGGLALSPDGSRVIVADRRSPFDRSPVFSFALLDPDSLSQVGSQIGLNESSDVWETGGQDNRGELRRDNWEQMQLHRVAWVKRGDEEFLFAGGAFPCFRVRSDLLLAGSEKISNKQLCVLRWDMGTKGGAPRFIPIGTDLVVDVVGLPKSGGVLVGALRRIAALDVDGQPLKRADIPLLYEDNLNADFRVTNFDVQDFRVAVDGTQIEFADYTSLERIRFDVRTLRLTELGPALLSLPEPEEFGQLLGNWKNSSTPPTVRETSIRNLKLVDNERFRFVATAALKGRILIGSSETLRLVNYDSGEARQECAPLKISEEAFRVALPSNADLAVVGHSDGTIRWYRIDAWPTGCKLSLILSVYVYKTSSGQWTWTAWRPSGHFARSAASRSILEWQTSSAKRKVLRTPFERLLKKYDWDVVSAALQPVQAEEPPDEDEIRDQAENAGGVRVAHPISNPYTPNYEFELEFEDLQNWPKQVVVRVCDGPLLKTVFQGRVHSSLESIALRAQDLNENKARFTVELPASLRRLSGSEIRLCVQLDGRPAIIHSVLWLGDPVKVVRRKLHAILIGAASYQDANIASLSFADNDALDVAQLLADDFEGRGDFRRYFDDIQIDLFVSTASAQSRSEIDGLVRSAKYIRSKPAVKSEILNALDDAVQKRIDGDPETENLFLFYYSGHGFTSASASGRAVLALPSLRADYSNLSDSVLTGLELSQFIKQIDARKVVIFDTCRTLMGAEYDSGLLRSEIGDPAETDLFFSSTKSQPSLALAGLHVNERRQKDRWGNSLFTYALIRMLQDPKSGSPSKMITFRELGSHLNGYFQNLQDPSHPERKAKEFEQLTYVPIPQIDTRSPDKVVRMRK